MEHSDHWIMIRRHGEQLVWTHYNNQFVLILNILSQFTRTQTKTYHNTTGEAVQSCIIFHNVLILTNILLIETLKPLSWQSVSFILIQDLYGSFHKQKINLALTFFFRTVENPNDAVISSATDLGI